MHEEPGTSGQLCIEAEFYQFENKSVYIRKYLLLSQFTYFRVDFFPLINLQEVVYFCVMFSYLHICVYASQSYQRKITLKD